MLYCRCGILLMMSSVVFSYHRCILAKKFNSGFFKVLKKKPPVKSPKWHMCYGLMTAMLKFLTADWCKNLQHLLNRYWWKKPNNTFWGLRGLRFLSTVFVGWTAMWTDLQNGSDWGSYWRVSDCARQTWWWSSSLMSPTQTRGWKWSRSQCPVRSTRSQTYKKTRQWWLQHTWWWHIAGSSTRMENSHHRLTCTLTTMTSAVAVVTAKIW